MRSQIRSQNQRPNRKFNKHEKINQVKGVRYSKLNQVKEEFDINKQNFPILVDNVPEESNNVKDFKKLEFNEEKEIEKTTDNIKKGWLILNEDNLNKYKQERERLKNIEDNKNIKKGINKLVQNWENYRKEDIRLMGDRSRYINTENEINEMIKEERKILREIEDYNEDKKKNRLISKEEKEELEEYY